MCGVFPTDCLCDLSEKYLHIRFQEEKIMKKYGVNELRQMFLDFMESKGHLVMKSFSLVPQGDKSLLLINAGMAPLLSLIHI